MSESSDSEISESEMSQGEGKIPEEMTVNAILLCVKMPVKMAQLII